MAIHTQDRTMSRWDAVGLVIFMLAGVAIAVGTIVSAVMRILEVLPNQDVRVFAPFAGTIAEAPIGPDGALVAVELESAIVTAPTLPPTSLIALVLQQVALAATVVTVVVCLLLVMRSILRGRVFSRANTGLITAAGFTGIIGFAAVPFFGNMGANGAFAEISEGTFDNVILSVDLLPLILLAFVAALASTVFTIGDRMRRDTEGLV